MLKTTDQIDKISKKKYKKNMQVYLSNVDKKTWHEPRFHNKDMQRVTYFA